MNSKWELVETEWGMHLNSGALFSFANLPEWASRHRKTDFDKRGLIVWDNETHTAARLRTKQILKIYGQGKSSDDLEKSGIVIGEPATSFSLDRPNEEPKKVLINQIQLSCERLEQFLALIEGNLHLIEEMAEDEEEEERRLLARVYSLILQFGEDEKEK